MTGWKEPPVSIPSRRDFCFLRAPDDGQSTALYLVEVDRFNPVEAGFLFSATPSEEEADDIAAEFVVSIPSRRDFCFLRGSGVRNPWRYSSGFNPVEAGFLFSAGKREVYPRAIP